MDQVIISRELLRQAIDAMSGVAEWVELRPKTHPWDAFKKLDPAITALRTALEQPAVEPVNFNQIAADRYKVVEAHESLFHRWAVVAGNGTRQLYVGREVECQNMARKFAGAFLDGAWLASQHTAPQAQHPDARRQAIQECIDRLIKGGKPAEAQMLRHHFGVGA